METLNVTDLNKSTIFYFEKRFPMYLYADYYATASLLFWILHQKILTMNIIQQNTDEGS